MRAGIKYVRAGEIFEIRDEDNVLLNDSSKPDERARGRIGTKRKIRLHLDPSQYYEDMKVVLMIGCLTHAILEWCRML
jgi:hypothetical protein